MSGTEQGTIGLLGLMIGPWVSADEPGERDRTHLPCRVEGGAPEECDLDFDRTGHYQPITAILYTSRMGIVASAIQADVT